MAHWTILDDSAPGQDVALLLPGLRYGCDRPLLTGTAERLARHGLRPVRLRLTYADDPAFMALPEAEQIARIRQDGAAILAAVRTRRPGRVILCGKSLGTIAMAGMDPPPGTPHLWLTPSLTGTGIAPVIAARTPGLMVIGTRDPGLAAARALAGPALAVIKGADHAWDGEGRDVLTPALEAIENWLAATI